MFSACVAAVKCRPVTSNLVWQGIELGTSRTQSGCVASAPPSQLRVFMVVDLLNYFDAMCRNVNKQSWICEPHIFIKYIFHIHLYVYIIFKFINCIIVYLITISYRQDPNNVYRIDAYQSSYAQILCGIAFAPWCWNIEHITLTIKVTAIKHIHMSNIPVSRLNISECYLSTMQCDHDKNLQIPHMTKFLNKFNTWQKTFEFKRSQYKNHTYGRKTVQ